MPRGTHTRGEFAQNVLAILADHPNGMQAKDVLVDLVKRMPPTPFEAQDYPKHPGTRRFEKTARFNTIAPVKAGWMTKNKGIWTITDEGRRVLKEFPDPNKLEAEIHRLWVAWKESNPSESEPEEETTSVSATSGTLEESEEVAFTQISDYLHAMPPYDFQNFVAGLLRGMGYNIIWIAPPGKDDGIDIVASADPLGVTGPRLKVQVKRRESKVVLDELKAFMTSVGDNDVGLYVSTGGFTADAEAKARAAENRRVTLLDIEKLFDLVVQHYGKVDEVTRRLLPLRAIYYLDLLP